MQEKLALFVLYFGPDNDGLNETITNDLLDHKTNKGKNNLLVSFANKLKFDLSQYHCNHSNLENSKKELSECNRCNHYNEEKDEITKVYNCMKDEYTVFDESDCTERQSHLKQLIKGYDVIVIDQDKVTKLQTLSDIMRIYVKLNGIVQKWVSN